MRRNAYLAAYNAVQATGWLTAFVLALLALGKPGEPAGASVFAASGLLVTVFQAAALLETGHSLLGLVKSSPLNNLLFWLGRSHCWLLVLLRPELRVTPATAVVVLAWSLADVVRFSWAFSGCLQSERPSALHAALTWLRYTLFLPLFPCGLVAEVLLMRAVIPAAKGGFLSLKLPNAANVALRYDLFLTAVLTVYPPLFWKLFTGLIRQRSRKLPHSVKQKGA